MNDNDIIEALETCVNLNCYIDGCPFMFGECGAETSTEECLFKMIKCAFGLVKRYRAEIERLQKHNTDMARKHYNDGIKEFVERLEKDFPSLFAGQHPCVLSEIDFLVKEMTEGKDGNV
jgi:hypothetical protein